MPTEDGRFRKGPPVFSLPLMRVRMPNPPASNAETDMDFKKLAAAFHPCTECAAHRASQRVHLPSTAHVAVTLRRLLALLFPGCYGLRPVPASNCRQHVENQFEAIGRDIANQIFQLKLYFQDAAEPHLDLDATRQEAESLAESFMARLPAIRQMLQTDVTAAYEGDPAASSTMEVVLAYPGLQAIAVHRLAHAFYELKIPVLPRVMSEIAHSRTGIDIHPGATIGERFFIDHGTGVVIGETTVIGKNVKLYQGVTLGALSFPKDEATGMLMKGHKRHPNVEDNVVIYAGATILGGDTTIGHDSEIGGNVWLMDSIPPFSRVYNQTPFPRVKTRAG